MSKVNKALDGRGGPRAIKKENEPYVGRNLKIYKPCGRYQWPTKSDVRKIS
jgi:hypothetical protein